MFGFAGLSAGVTSSTRLIVPTVRWAATITPTEPTTATSASTASRVRIRGRRRRRAGARRNWTSYTTFQANGAPGRVPGGVPVHVAFSRSADRVRGATGPGRPVSRPHAPNSSSGARHERPPPPPTMARPPRTASRPDTPRTSSAARHERRRPRRPSGGPCGKRGQRRWTTSPASKRRVMPHWSRTTSRPSRSTSIARPKTSSPPGSSTRTSRAERRQRGAVDRPDVGRLGVERAEQCGQHVERFDVGAVAREPGRALRRPAHVQPDADDDEAGARLGEHAGQLAAVDQQVVRPLEHRADPGDRGAGLGRGQGDAPGELVGHRRHVAEQDRHEQVRARRRVPAAVQPAAPGGLVAGGQHAVVGRPADRGRGEVDVRASRRLDHA